MNVFELKPGDTVVFSYPQNGYDHDVLEAREHLEPGKSYMLERVRIGGWEARLYLKEVPGVSFNSVQFSTGEEDVQKAFREALEEIRLTADEFRAWLTGGEGMSAGKFEDDVREASSRTVEFREDVERIRLLLNAEGFTASGLHIATAYGAWSEDTWCAGWDSMPECNNRLRERVRAMIQQGYLNPVRTA